MMLVKDLRAALADLPDLEIVYCSMDDGGTNTPIERVQLLAEELSNGEVNFFGVVLHTIAVEGKHGGVG